MSEYPSEKQRREEWEVREMVAEYRAMPLRAITFVETNGKIAALDCGHRRVLLVWLLVGDSMRCRKCYEERMREAQAMVEKVCGL